MASNNNVHIGKPPHFDGNNYDYWKIRMSMHLRVMGGNFWPIVKDGFVVLKEDEPSVSDNENCRRGNSPAGWRSAPALNPKMRKGLKRFACLAKR
jgi:hypothetical protein